MVWCVGGGGCGAVWCGAVWCSVWEVGGVVRYGVVCVCMHAYLGCMHHISTTLALW